MLLMIIRICEGEEQSVWRCVSTPPPPPLAISINHTILHNMAEKIYKTNHLGEGVYYHDHLIQLQTSYDKYLETYINATKEFEKNINNWIENFINMTNIDDGLFSFLTCGIIGNNLRIMLKYLRSSFSEEVKPAGTILSLVGTLNLLSISFTILLMPIIDSAVIEEERIARNKRLAQNSSSVKLYKKKV